MQKRQRGAQQPLATSYLTCKRTTPVKATLMTKFVSANSLTNSSSDATCSPMLAMAGPKLCVWDTSTRMSSTARAVSRQLTQATAVTHRYTPHRKDNHRYSPHPPFATPSARPHTSLRYSRSRSNTSRPKTTRDEVILRLKSRSRPARWRWRVVVWVSARGCRDRRSSGCTRCLSRGRPRGVSKREKVRRGRLTCQEARRRREDHGTPHR